MDLILKMQPALLEGNIKEICVLLFNGCPVVIGGTTGGLREYSAFALTKHNPEY